MADRSDHEKATDRRAPDRGRDEDSFVGQGIDITLVVLLVAVLAMAFLAVLPWLLHRA